ncbi:hypothetical protein [Erwinia sp. S38]|uniref:hypothetical protein n=1 Tax=Erwinia sp. S38 TaxID=2769338 RepID=UPI001909AEFC|nr:hypothetical protein [Erwinia sp. S38]MBK0003182.1 hypothetical protein [Erwinia sp. S38]
MSGLRLVSNKFIPVTSWDHDFVVVNSRLVDDIPLPCLAAFDLLNPLDNSGHGWKVTIGGGIIKKYGLGFSRVGGGAGTDFIANKESISVVCAVKPNSFDAFSTFIDSRTINNGASSGFAVDFSNATQKMRLNLIYPSGVTEAVQFPTFVMGEWNIFCFTLSPRSVRGENHLGEIITKEFSTPVNVGFWSIPLKLGTSVTNGTCDGDVGFVAIYDGYMTPEQRKNSVSVAKDIISKRNNEY